MFKAKMHNEDNTVKNVYEILWSNIHKAEINGYTQINRWINNRQI